MQKRLEAYIKGFVKDYPNIKGTITKWGEPLITFCDANNREFEKLKKVVTPEHSMPRDFLPDAKTIIAYFLPFEEAVIKSNIKGIESSKEWGVAYIETNKLIYDLNSYIFNIIKELGYEATIIPATHNFDEKKLVSQWSHRHVAYIAGLGKFGLNNMLITEKGCCGRVGSIVTSLKIETTGFHNEEYCIYKVNGGCKKCVKACVNGSLQIDSFNRHKCYEMCLYNDNNLGDIGVADVCGKCTVGMPCSTKIPTR
ncbi:epoxyqueuosine reductase [Alkaliphilus pronyensis]|uniref:Epoxyqueuosine reductase n=1 Tax=Alkaliphilus pronyensis TaxID=1482732 RepID=A0A6I0F6U4_9FIRM|nr:epoxyqueuosine reductase [Alkaliphilus pronyensis]KAB3535759.1 epoxyqueuosine reductase [Alkaliphilus pronyensis]